MAPALRAWARSRLGPDPYGTGPQGDEYETTSLYFDTDALDVFHQRGSFGRAKYRVRRYRGQTDVFLERKLRTAALLAKRRTQIAGHDLARILTSADRAWDGAWFQQRLAMRQLRPAVQVSYHRMARMGAGPQGIVRLTLDQQLCVMPAQRADFRLGTGQLVTQELILELKYRGPFPSLFKELVQTFALNPGRVSKYRMAAAALGFGAEAMAVADEPELISA